MDEIAELERKISKEQYLLNQYEQQESLEEDPRRRLRLQENIEECKDRILTFHVRITQIRQQSLSRPSESAQKSTFGVSLRAGEKRVWEKDGKVMVYVPAGEFLYGDDKQKIHLDGFWIDKTPVTNAEYKRFLDANPKYRIPRGWDEIKRIFPSGKEQHPVVYVSWYDVTAYANWVGKRLPLEQEWEKAARGTDGREYPWGNEWMNDRANTNEVSRGTSPVGQFSPQGDSPYGCVDMAGNVWEWTGSWGDEKQNIWVLRGGSWQNGRRSMRVVVRDFYNPAPMYEDIGFRLVSHMNRMQAHTSS